MKRAYGQFLGLAAFEPCENARGAVIKKSNEVGEANEGVNVLPINAAYPFTVKVFRGHLFGIYPGSVSLFETDDGRGSKGGIMRGRRVGRKEGAACSLAARPP